MSQTNSAPRKKSQPYKKEEYYWRGGDVLKEREYLTDQFRKALTEYRKADSELKQVESECQQAQETLHEREEYTSALANYLDSDAEGGLIEAEYKRRLAELEDEIRQAEAELQEARAVHHPAVASGLQKEKAYLLIENQRTAKAVDLAGEQTENAKKQLAACMVSNKYRQAKELEEKHAELSRKKAFLRQMVNQCKKEFDDTRPVAAPQTPEARLERAALQPQVEIDETLRREDEKKQRRPRKWEGRLGKMIDDIEELNERLVDLGMDDQVVDVEALREKFLPKKEEEEKKDEQEEE